MPKQPYPEPTPAERELAAKIAQYRKRPIAIEAVQWDGDATTANTFIGERYGTDWHYDGSDIIIPTPEGNMRGGLGDWIIKGVKGEFYPCKADIFAATYEPVVEGERPASAAGGVPIEIVERVRARCHGYGAAIELSLMEGRELNLRAMRDGLQEANAWLSAAIEAARRSPAPVDTPPSRGVPVEACKDFVRRHKQSFAGFSFRITLYEMSKFCEQLETAESAEPTLQSARRSDQPPQVRADDGAGPASGELAVERP